MPLDAETMDGDYARISSVGFGDDGCFHLLTAFSGEANHEFSSMNVSITDTRDGAGLCATSDSFCLDGTWYSDMRYDFGPEDFPYMEFGDFIAWYYFHDTVHGDWSVDVTIEPVDEEIIYKPNTMIYDILLEEVQVTPLSVTVINHSGNINIPYEYREFFSNLNVCANLRDGTQLGLSGNKINSGSHDQ